MFFYIFYQALLTSSNTFFLFQRQLTMIHSKRYVYNLLMNRLLSGYSIEIDIWFWLVKVSCQIS